MSDELKPQSIDSKEFRKLVRDVWKRASMSSARLSTEEVALIAHIDAWGARLAGDAAKDSARVDFMIAEECQIEHIDLTGKAPLHRVRWPWQEEHMGEWSATGREAIDAAMIAATPTPDKGDACGL